MDLTEGIYAFRIGKRILKIHFGPWVRNKKSGEALMQNYPRRGTDQSRPLDQGWVAEIRREEMSEETAARIVGPAR